MNKESFQKLKSAILKAPDTQISKKFKNKLEKINYGDLESLKIWIEESIESGEVSTFAINTVGVGLYNSQKENS